MEQQNINSYQLYPLGDSAIVVLFGKEISEALHAKIQAFAAYLHLHPFEGMIEYVPAFTTITIYYDPWVVSRKGKHNPYERVVSKLQHIISHKVPDKPVHKSRTIEIPVCYGGSFGPDLEFVARHTKLTPEEVIAIHSMAEYLVYMIGFAPGFPYLGGMSEKISAPRKETPRSVIPQGSVGIAGIQTGVYPLETPGGWQLIGRTPLPLFQPLQSPPSLLQSGNKVRFVPITEHEFHARKEQAHVS